MYPAQMPFASAVVDAVRHHRLLERVTLGYLALPFLVFAAGWLRPIVAIPVVALTLAGLYVAQRRDSGDAGTPVEADPRKLLSTYGVILAVVVLVVLASGTGNYAPALGGHGRNNAFLFDLMRYPWPVGFEDLGRQREPGVLAFYIGNSILPALVGSLLGWAAAYHFQFVYTYLGVFLAACWFLRVVGRTSLWYALLFLCFGGLDLVFHWSIFGWYSGLRQPPDLWMLYYSTLDPTMGGVFWIFPSNLTILYRSPHHVLASWLALLVIVDDAVHRGTCRRAGFVSAFCLLWSAFSFVGLAPFVLASLFATRGRGMWSFENVAAGVVVLGVTALYIGSNNGSFPHGPLWSFQNLAETWRMLLFVCAFEFGIYVVLILLVKRGGSGLGHPLWLWTAVATLLLLPWYRIGKFCDFTTKGSLPALLVVQLCVAYAIASAGRARRVQAAALVAVVVFGSASALALITYGLSNGLTMSPPRVGRTLAKISRGSEGMQLFSDGRGLFWEHMAKPVEYQSPSLPPGQRALPRGGAP
jgi:hypothetical protein